jgi:TatD DNase family protein
MLVDSHCHLDFPQFADALDEIVQRARDAGVGRLLTICTRLDRLQRNLDLIDRFDDVSLAVGVHPHEADSAADLTVDRLVEIAAHPKIVGIGETGLDFYYDNSPRPAQVASFRIHMQAARETGLPLIVHTRDADDETIRLLREGGAGEGGDKPLRGVIHCFSSGRQLAESAIEMGFYVSLSGIVTFKRSEDIRSIVRDLPIDRLLVETDAPYLAPVPKRGKQNEPSYVVHTALAVAEVKGVGAAEIARITTNNFLILFDKVPAPADLAA